MFDFVQKHNFIIKGILTAVALTFVGFGISSYAVETEEPYLAKVEGHKITRQALEEVLQGQPNITPLDRQQALMELIRKNVLLVHADRLGIYNTPDQLRARISGLAGFQDQKGQFSPTLYQNFLKSRQWTAEQFESRIGEDLRVQHLVSSFIESALSSETSLARYQALLAETRTVSRLIVKPESFFDGIQLKEEAIQAYYEANKATFKTPERVKVEYIVYSQAEMLAQDKSGAKPEALRQKIQQRYQAGLERFNELIYQKADSLKPAAEAAGIQVRSSEWLTRKEAKEAFLNHQSLLQAVFSDEVLKAKHNSEAIEVAPGTLVAVRVMAHEPATQQTLAQVKPLIVDKLKRKEAIAKAEAQGRERLARLQKDASAEKSAGWEAARPMSRLMMKLDPAEAKAIFAHVSSSTLPFYTGHALKEGGFALYRIEKVEKGPSEDTALRQQIEPMIRQARLEAETQAYLAGLENHYKIQLKKVDFSAQ